MSEFVQGIGIDAKERYLAFYTDENKTEKNSVRSAGIVLEAYRNAVACNTSRRHLYFHR